MFRRLPIKRLFHLVLRGRGTQFAVRYSSVTLIVVAFSLTCVGQKSNLGLGQSDNKTQTDSQVRDGNRVQLSEKERADLLLRRKSLVSSIEIETRKGNADAVVELLELRLDIEQKLVGENDKRLIGTLSHLGDWCLTANKITEAIQYKERAVGIGEKVLDSDSFDLKILQHSLLDALILSILPESVRNKWMNQELETSGDTSRFPLADDAARAVLEPKLFLKLLRIKSNRCKSLGQYDDAIACQYLAMAVVDEHFKLSEQERARCASELGLLLMDIGDFEKAEKLFMESVELRSKIVRIDSPLQDKLPLAVGLNNFGTLYLRNGNLSQAKTCFIDALKWCGPMEELNASIIMAVQTNLAKVHESLGDNLSALTTLERLSLDLNNSKVARDRSNYATYLNNFGYLHFVLSNFEEAARLHQEAMSLREHVLGGIHPDYAQSLVNLAAVYKATGDRISASKLFRKALEIYRTRNDSRNPDYARCLDSLALISCAEDGNTRGAEQMFLEAMQMRENVLGKQHPDYATSLNNLGFLYDKMNRDIEAKKMFVESLNMTNVFLNKQVYELAERQQIEAMRDLRYRLDNYLSLISKVYIGGQRETLDAFQGSYVLNDIVPWKGSVLGRLRNVRATRDDPESSRRLAKLQAISAQISSMRLQSINLEESTRWKERLAKLSTEKEQLEAELMRKSAAFAKASKRVTLEDIQKAIPEDGVLVDFLEFNGKEGPELVASIVYPSSEPQMVFLGSNKELGARIDGWLGSHGDTPEAQQAGQELRKQLWEPLLPLIENAKMILVSTDGDLGRFPIAALPGKETGKYLIEEHRLVMIPVPQLLPELMESNIPSDLPRGLLAMGAIDYNAEPESRPTSQTTESDTKKKLDSLAMRTRSDLPDSVRGNSKWVPLDATGPEVDFVTKLYTQKHNSPDSTIVKLDRSAASEASFRALATGSKFIHLATHGFFADPDKKSALSSEMVAQSAQDEMFSLGDKHKIVRGHNPGQLSGLVFAGANRTAPVITIDNLTENHGENDGILTADEIAFLRLEGCELVVLSACQTGLGATAGGEGILGLQRSFQLAGARSVVSSLWNVNDEATNQLMQLFYTNVWTHKQSKLDALRNAQLDMLNFYDSDTHKLSADKIRADRSQPVEMKLVPKKDPQASKSIDRSKRLSPRFWAAFQLSGDWR